MDDISNALDALASQIKPEQWVGRTYADFWEWFEGEEERIDAIVPPEKRDEVFNRLLDLRDAAYRLFSMLGKGESDVIPPATG